MTLPLRIQPRRRLLAALMIAGLGLLAAPAVADATVTVTSVGGTITVQATDNIPPFVQVFH